MKSKTEEYKKIIVPIICKHLPDARVILYGSRARKDESEGSDIDIALDIGTVIEFRKLSKIISDLEESNLPIHFDIVDFHRVSERMQREIVKDGLLWKK